MIDDDAFPSTRNTDVVAKFTAHFVIYVLKENINVYKISILESI